MALSCERSIRAYNAQDEKKFPQLIFSGGRNHRTQHPLKATRRKRGASLGLLSANHPLHFRKRRGSKGENGLTQKMPLAAHDQPHRAPSRTTALPRLTGGRLSTK